jgi:hypothetical protein
MIASPLSPSCRLCNSELTVTSQESRMAAESSGATGTDHGTPGNAHDEDYSILKRTARMLVWLSRR